MKTSNAMAAPALVGGPETWSLASRARGLFADVLGLWRASAEERRARRALAELDDTLLLDIGIAADEIARIRAEVRFTPRAFVDRGDRTPVWEA